MSKEQCSQEWLEQLFRAQRARCYEYFIYYRKVFSVEYSTLKLYNTEFWTAWAISPSTELEQLWSNVGPTIMKDDNKGAAKFQRILAAKRAYEDADGVWFGGAPRFVPKHLQI